MADTSPLQQAYEKLDETRETIGNLLSDPKFSAFKNMAAASLTNLSNHFRSRSGSGLIDTARRKFEPLTPGTKEATGEVVEDLKTPAQLEGEQLNADVSALYEGFADRDTSEILDSVDETQLRGVAIMAGMPVTETQPDKLDVAFVEEVKQAIQTQVANKALTDNPDAVAQDEVKAINEELKQVEKEKAEVEKSISRARSAERKAELQAKVDEYNARQTELNAKLESLNP